MGDLKIVLVGGVLTITALDYHVAPILLNDVDLGKLGLVHDSRRDGSLTRADFLLSSDRLGVWIQMNNYHARPLRLSLPELATLGLRPIAPPVKSRA